MTAGQHSTALPAAQTQVTALLCCVELRALDGARTPHTPSHGLLQGACVVIFSPIMQLTVPSTITIYYGADPLRRVPSSARRL